MGTALCCIYQGDMKIRGFVLVMTALLWGFQLHARDGMWIPMLLQQLNEAEMQAMGLKLTAEDIYSVNHSSLKDGIVKFGRGCTGEIVSGEGLLLTNHHCGFGAIQSHSAIEHDYLTDGFWAMNREEELPNEGLTVTFLVRIEDVTNSVLEGVTHEMTEVERNELIEKNIVAITRKANSETHYSAEIKPFYYGNQYYMFVNEVFRDVRLVGAPPSNIGKFGGDTDNWMWPRHTGDFSVFRVYADKNNNPADYSKDNVPYKPKYHFPISLKGVDKGDFTMVFGYPANTTEYLPGFAVEQKVNEENPVRITLRQRRLEIMNRYMVKNPAVRIQYASKYAHVANGWKKWIGESKGIRRMHGVEKKQRLESKFKQWAGSSADLEKRYGGLLDAFEQTYQQYGELNGARTYLFEAGMAVEIVQYARSFNRLVSLSKKKPMDIEKVNNEILRLKSAAENHFKDYYEPIDRDNCEFLLNSHYNGMKGDLLPPVLAEIHKKYKGDWSNYTDDFFKTSIFNNKEKVINMLNGYKPSKYKNIAKDPAFRLASDLVDYYLTDLYQPLRVLDNRLDSLQRIYMDGLMTMQEDVVLPADANFTLRLSYGQVNGYKPADGVEYKYFTTLSGIMEKENPDIYDYVVEDKLKTLYQNRDYGKYADKDGAMHVAFIASNHTTGGNSGSPVINGNGELIGINFDRNWEGTMSDLMYDPDMCRNITLDIRYCMFVIDKYAGASHLVKEMTLVE